jgi:Tfp pilus assembly protein PilO
MKNKSTTSLIGILVFMALFMLVLFIYGELMVKNLNKKTVALNQELKISAEDVSSFQSIKAMQAEADSNLDKLDALQLSEDEVVDLIETIEATGRSLGLIVSTKAVSVEKVGEDEFPKIVRLSIEARGSWQSTVTMLEAIESLPYLVVISEASLLKEEKSWELELNMGINIFN